jgi:uncharacterized protein YjiS (DUF1127 family)
VRAARAIAQELRIRRDTRELMAMSDHMLKDIGLTRAEIGPAVRYGRLMGSTVAKDETHVPPAVDDDRGRLCRGRAAG